VVDIGSKVPLKAAKERAEEVYVRGNAHGAFVWYFSFDNVAMN